MNANQVHYLRGLVRVEIRRHQRGIDRFVIRPGQDPVEAAAVLDKFEQGQTFRREVLEALRVLADESPS